MIRGGSGIGAATKEISGPPPADAHGQRK